MTSTRERKHPEAVANSVALRGNLEGIAAGACEAQVQLVILIANHGFVEAAGLLEDFAAPASQVHGVHGTLVPGSVPAGAASRKRAMKRGRDGASYVAVALRDARSADVISPCLFQGLHRAAVR